MGPPGHLGIAFASKPAAPKAPLWALLLASEALDVLSFGFLALGMEKNAVSEVSLSRGIEIVSPGSIPWSHGLVMSLAWSLLFGALAYWFTRDRRSGVALGAVVFSHWLLDFVVHTPDLPLLFEDSPIVGLGLWGSGPGLIVSVLLELGLLLGGVVLYIRWRKKKQASRQGANP